MKNTPLTNIRIIVKLQREVTVYQFELGLAFPVLSFVSPLFGCNMSPLKLKHVLLYPLDPPQYGVEHAEM